MTADAERSLVRLMAWLSPAFPVGAFGYSHGLEQAVAEGRVRDGATLLDWLGTLLARGSGWSDAVLLAAAHRAAGDDAALAEIAELALALSPSAERLRETRDQGSAFAAAQRAWDRAASTLDAPYPVAVGVAAARAGIALPHVLPAYLHAFTGNLVSIAVRAVPLGQFAGVGVVARLEPEILALAARAANSTLDDLGGAAMISDIVSMRHETLRTRIFIS